jgi:hypothetical protein
MRVVIEVFFSILIAKVFAGIDIEKRDVENILMDFL